MPLLNVNGKQIFHTDTEPQREEVGSSPSRRKTTTTTTTLFIHGLGSSSCFYETITPQLRSVSRCIALDTPGSGLSTLGAGEQQQEQSVDTITADVVGLLDALGIHERVVVVGHSMGGILASALAASDSGRVVGVVLIGPVNPSPAAAEVFRKRIEAVKKDGLETLAGTIPTAATGTKSTPLHRAFIRSLILGTSREGYVSLCNVIATAARPDYESIKVPLLIIAGEDDKTAPLSGCAAILDAYGTVKEEKHLQSLGGVGHWHCVEDPTSVGRLIESFIQQLS